MVKTAQSRTAQSRTLAVDYGRARIGLAISDGLGITGQALETILGDRELERAAKKMRDRIVQLEQENGWHIGTIVIGLPLHMSGEESERSQEARQLAQLLQPSFTTKKIALFDERMTSLQAERAMKELGLLSRKKRAQKVDSISALILLQSYLDSLRA